MLRDAAFAAAPAGLAPLGWRDVADDDGFFFFGIVVGVECEVRGQDAFPIIGLHISSQTVRKRHNTREQKSIRVIRCYD